MAYLCDDCSYRGMTSGQAGECPACGSYNIRRQILQSQEAPTPRKWRLTVLALLWTCLLVMVYWKLVN